MIFIIILLSLLLLGSFIWTIIQIFKPELFFKAENKANLDRKRPKWYLFGGIIGIIVLVVLWLIAINLDKTSVWILIGIFTAGSIKPIGIVFFYKKFSNSVTSIVNQMQKSKKTNNLIILSRAVLTIILLISLLYFSGVFGIVR